MMPRILPDDDISFLHEEENWCYGPTVDLLMFYGTTACPDSVRTALFSTPNVIGPFAEIRDIPARTAYRPSDAHVSWSAYLVACDSQGRIASFGGYSYVLARGGGVELMLCVYPSQVERVCGAYPWCYDRTWVTPPVIDFHRVLVRLARDIHERQPFRLATITDEANAWHRDDIEGIAIRKEVADRAGWNTLRTIDGMAVLAAVESGCPPAG